MKQVWIVSVVGLAVLGVVLACAFPHPVPDDQRPPEPYGGFYPPLSGKSPEPLQPMPALAGLDEAKIALGRQLFHDPRLSGRGDFACVTCHNLAMAGIDGLTRSTTIDGQPDEMNTPTVFNSAFNYRFGWSGRFESLEEQLDGVINNPLHMNSSWELIVERLQADPEMTQAFSVIYPDGVTPGRIRNAITTFERSLVTRDTPFDNYLLGQKDAIDENAAAGYRLFKSYGCTSCHQGINVGGNLLARLGVFKNYFKGKKALSRSDMGRFTITGLKSDKHIFRVPSLRNVARTAPYFHDGSRKTLEDAVSTMALYQLGREMPDEDVILIVGFLQTLTGSYQGEPL